MPTLDEINVEVTKLRNLVRGTTATGMAGIGGAVVGTSGDVHAAQENVIAQIGSLPDGGIHIGIFNTTCPTGWTRVAALDDQFLRCAATYGGAGGAATHTHTCSTVIAHAHDGGTLSLQSDGTHTHSYTMLSGTSSGNTGGTITGIYTTAGSTAGSGGSHTHSISGNSQSYGDASFSTGSANTPSPYLEVILCSKN